MRTEFIRLANQVPDELFSRVAELKIVASGQKKKDVSRELGLPSPTDFSAFLHGYRPWPVDVKAQLIKLLSLQDLIFSLLDKDEAMGKDGRQQTEN